jgi:hypothetical protein
MTGVSPFSLRSLITFQALMVGCLTGVFVSEPEKYTRANKKGYELPAAVNNITVRRSGTPKLKSSVGRRY